MSAQGKVLKFAATSAGAFVTPPLLFWFVTAAVAAPFLLLMVGGRKSPSARKSAKDLKLKESAIERETLDRFDDDGGNQQI